MDDLCHKFYFVRYILNNGFRGIISKGWWSFDFIDLDWNFWQGDFENSIYVQACTRILIYTHTESEERLDDASDGNWMTFIYKIWSAEASTGCTDSRCFASFCHWIYARHPMFINQLSTSGNGISWTLQSKHFANPPIVSSNHNILNVKRTLFTKNCTLNV